MKQHITMEQWHMFLLDFPEEAKNLQSWLDERDYPAPTDGGCVLYDTQPVASRMTIGRMIEYLSNPNWPFLKIFQGKTINASDAAPDTWVEVDEWEVFTVNPDEEYKSEELVDCLWAAVVDAAI